MTAATTAPSTPSPTARRTAFEGYGGQGFDELVDHTGAARPGEALHRHLASLTFGELMDRQRAAEADIAAQGITFTVYAEGAYLDRAWPMDIVPRVFAASEWGRIEAGLAQRADRTQPLPADGALTDGLALRAPLDRLFGGSGLNRRPGPRDHGAGAGLSSTRRPTTVGILPTRTATWSPTSRWSGPTGTSI